MTRVNFTLDSDTIALLGQLSDRLFGGNRSLTIRAAVESLAAHSGHAGWVVRGVTPVDLDREATCHSCAQTFQPGSTLFRPVFERGIAPDALPELPATPWLDCARCVGGAA